ncbi:amidohydrolase family protein [Prochlorococcus sp. MIT 1223]|uniref:amidohydrolase family protein n=1 Tax=Prochlorococcus sp. MIT 1223 TaxID=3096217 RepID=UPI002A761F32|nr:amidohydrolase family protein [Prochlorococcus sp. MIT 1223]
MQLTSSGKRGRINALVPRGLVENFVDILSTPVTQEGLCPLSISWERGKVIKIEGAQNLGKTVSKLLLPRLVEPHAHIDKVFTWKNFNNLMGTYEGALTANLDELQSRTPHLVHLRAEKALHLALRNGLRSVRTHIDSFGLKGRETWEVLSRLKKEWKGLIELQCVALVPLNYWGTVEGQLFATRVATENGLLGGVLVPPFDKKKSFMALCDLICLANEIGCGLDLHIDEAGSCPGVGIKQLLRVLDQVKTEVPITCSHASSMGLLRPKPLKYFSERLAHHQVSVVALPLTNGWLLGRREKETPINRPLAPIKQLQNAGVIVAIGCDNVQDPWFPLGNLDPISLMSVAMPLTQLAPWQRLGLSPFTTSASSLIGLKWDGMIYPGCPADFVLLDANSWSETLSTIPMREHIINGDFYDKNMLPINQKSINLET